MIGILVLMAAQATTPPKDNEPRSDDIVVTAIRSSCRIRFADKTMTDAAFKARAAEWKAGKPVRVISRADADFACVRKIAYKLFAMGVTRIEFVDPDGKPALPFRPSADLPRYTR